MSDYVCERMVSTRKLTQFEITEDYIICQCGTSVRKVSQIATNEGIKGFEGLIDLPGTVASAIYGHATCYDCDLSKLLLEASILTSDGDVKTVKSDWFAFGRRNSALKRKEKKAIILSLKLRRDNGDADELKRIADENHKKRQTSQPEVKDSLGSIFRNSGRRTVLNYSLSAITRIYGILLKIIGYDDKIIEDKRKHLLFIILGASEIESYVRAWNWYQWRDERAHDLFWKYVKIHKLMFQGNEFEIEIKHNKNIKIP